MQDLAWQDIAPHPFLRALCHELRNPISPLVNGLQLLELSEGNQELVRETRLILERQVNLLNRIVNRVQDVSRLARNQITLTREPLDLRTVVREAVGASRTTFEEAGIASAVTLPPAPLAVLGDGRRLAEVVTILIDNAARFTARGGRTEISAGREGDRVVLRVKDTGIGISPERLPHVFNVYATDAPPRDNSGGLGAGLAIAKGLVELHGGRIEARSEGERRGAEFLVVLPWHDAAHPVASRTAPESASGRRG